MSKKQLDALFREVISRDAAYESRILVSERPETQEIPEFSRRRFEKMLDRALDDAAQKKPKKEHPALSHAARVLGKVLVAAAACIVILFVTVMSSEAVRGRITKFLVSITPHYAEVSLDNNDGSKQTEKAYRYRIGYLPDGVELVSERISSGTDELYTRGEDGYMRFRATYGSDGTEIDTQNAKEIRTVPFRGATAVLIVRQDDSLELLWSNEKASFRLEGTLTEAEILMIAEHVQEELVPVADVPLDPSLEKANLFYAPEYVPEGFEPIRRNYSEIGTDLAYGRDEDGYLCIEVNGPAAVSQYDTEHAQRIESVTVRGEEALLIVSDDWTTLTWSTENAIFAVSGTLSAEEIVKIAESLREIQP